MLGKRFRRTTSMSHLGPAAAPPGTDATAAAASSQIPQEATAPHPAPPKAARPPALQAQKKYGGVEGRGDGDDDASDYADVNMAVVPTVTVCGLASQPQTQGGGTCTATTMASDMDMNMEVMVPGSEERHAGSPLHATVACYRGQTTGIAAGLVGNGDSVFEGSGATQVHGVLMPCFEEYSAGYGLMQHEMLQGMLVSMHASHGGHGKLEQQTISPVGFLDVCFLCKKRLRHERDIFIYRGDTAFCSEECRHRQIVSDERRSTRGSTNKRGGARATSSSTAVAA